MTNLAKRRRALMSVQGGGPPEPPFYVSGYLGNGMVYTFDALENAGEGNARYTSGYIWNDLQNKTNVNVGTSAYWSPWGKNSNYYYAGTWRNGAGGNFVTTEPFLDISQPFTVEVRCHSTKNSGTEQDSPTTWNALGGSALTLGVATATQQGGCDVPNGVLEFRIFANANTGENTGMQIFVGSNSGGEGNRGYCSFLQYGFDQKQWHTYSVTYDGKGKLSYYGDGALVATQDVSGVFYKNEAKWVRLHGSGTSGTNQRVFVGESARFAIYQKCLTPDEILSNYQNDVTRYS